MIAIPAERAQFEPVPDAVLYRAELTNAGRSALRLLLAHGWTVFSGINRSDRWDVVRVLTDPEPGPGESSRCDLCEARSRQLLRMQRAADARAWPRFRRRPR